MHCGDGIFTNMGVADGVHQRQRHLTLLPGGPGPARFRDTCSIFRRTSRLRGAGVSLGQILRPQAPAEREGDLSYSSGLFSPYRLLWPPPWEAQGSHPPRKVGSGPTVAHLIISGDCGCPL